MKKWLLGTCVLLIMINSVSGGVLRLRTGTVETMAEGPRINAVDDVQRGTINQEQVGQVPLTAHDKKGEFVVQFREGTARDVERQLNRMGVHVAAYVPDDAYVVMTTPDKLENVAAVNGVLWIGGYLPEYKVSPDLTRKSISLAGVRRDAANEPELEVVISVMLPRYVSDVVLAVEAMGGRIVETGKSRRWGTVRAVIHAADLGAVSDLGAVEWIEEYRQPKLMNNVAVQEAYMNVVPVWTNANLTGSGQIIAVGDSGLDTGNAATIHPDFSNRIHAAFGLVDANDWSDHLGHGTHVSGSVLGNGSAWSNGLFKGVAYEAKLVIQAMGGTTGDSDIYLPTPLNHLFQQAWSNDARIHSDSWGSSVRGEYTANSRSVDEFMWDYDDMLLLFSAGNSGNDTNGYGVIEDRTLGAPGTAKNVLTVGAAESLRPSGSGGYSSDIWATGSWAVKYPVNPIKDDLISTPWDGVHQGMAAFSSRGPCADGRIKPDVVAPGTDIISCRSRGTYAGTLWGTGSGVLGNAASNYYCFCGGTSMSTPLVAGAAGVARQYLNEYAGVTNPSAALVKALLICGARTITPGQYGTNEYREVPAARPNIVEGWGQVNLNNALFPDNSRQNIFWDRCMADTGVTNVFDVVVNSTNELHVMLVWSDYPASLSAAIQLVNDLDVKLVAPDGTEYYPFGASGADHTNNVLGIDLDEAQPGTNRIVVSGYNVPKGPQPYALLVQADGYVLSSNAVLATGIVGGRIIDEERALVTTVVTTNQSGIATVGTIYRVNSNSWTTLSMNYVSTEGNCLRYQVELPLFDAGDVVEFYSYALAYDMDLAVSSTSRVYVESRTIYVAKDGGNSWPYCTWETAFSSLTAAADYADEGFSIIVSNGVYSDGTLVLADGIMLTTANGWEHTSIDATGLGLCAIITDGAAVTGMTFTNGYGSACGGAYVDGAYLTNCAIFNSQSQEHGGGLQIGFSGGTVDSCLIAHNYAPAYGGGVLQRAGLMQNTIIRDNTSGSDGGGMEHWGGIVSNCTVAYNHSGNYAGGVDIGDPDAEVYNSIIVSNTAVVGGQNWYIWMAGMFEYCCSRPAPDGIGNFDFDADFADGPGRDFHLLSNEGRCLPDGTWTNDTAISACVDMGNPASSYTHEPSPNGERINLGAYGNTVQASKGSVSTYKIMVVSAHGQSTPSPGVYTPPRGILMTCNITNSLVEQPNTQYVHSGWSMMGMVDDATNSSGTGTNVSFTLTNNMVLSWGWDTNYMLTASANTNGTVPGITNGWYSAGTYVEVTAQPDQYYAFSQWTGTLVSTVNPLYVPMTQAHRLWASFSEALTSNGVPQLWFTQYGWSNNFNTVEMQDADGDGALTWQEYVAGTIPTASTSVLELITRHPGTGPLQLNWQAMADRTYTLYCSTNLQNGVTNFLFGITTLLPMPIALDDILHTNDEAVYYRVKVRRD